MPSISTHGSSSISVHRGSQGKSIDHTFITCLECRFIGEWQVDSQLHYRANIEGAELKLVRVDGTRLYLAFRLSAIVKLLPSNVVTYEEHDVLFYVNVDEDPQKFGSS